MRAAGAGREATRSEVQPSLCLGQVALLRQHLEACVQRAFNNCCRLRWQVRDDPLAATAQLPATLPWHIALQMAAIREVEKEIKGTKDKIAGVEQQLKVPDLDASERTALQQQLAEAWKRLNRLEEQAAGECAFIRCGIQGRALL